MERGLGAHHPHVVNTGILVTSKSVTKEAASVTEKLDNSRDPLRNLGNFQNVFIFLVNILSSAPYKVNCLPKRHVFYYLKVTIYEHNLDI